LNTLTKSGNPGFVFLFIKKITEINTTKRTTNKITPLNSDNNCSTAKNVIYSATFIANSLDENWGGGLNLNYN
jgi:hypothetical protein